MDCIVGWVPADGAVVVDVITAGIGGVPGCWTTVSVVTVGAVVWLGTACEGVVGVVAKVGVNIGVGSSSPTPAVGAGACICAGGSCGSFATCDICCEAGA